ncbi:MAG: DUF488 family protein [Alphaproteobacteria bacterium]|nr:DUF488 family protein [Alphaproteobacteria bacterium]
MIRTKNVHDPIDRKKDGLRILATRSLGMYLKSSRYDVWMANLGPTDTLRKSLAAGTISWGAFARAYRAELKESDTIDRRNGKIKNQGQKFTLRLLKELGRKGPVTLMCHCEDEDRCHRSVLKKVLAGKV